MLLLMREQVSQGNGCSINNTNSNAAGTGFDNNGGGVYAMEVCFDSQRIARKLANLFS